MEMTFSVRKKNTEKQQKTEMNISKQHGKK